MVDTVTREMRSRMMAGIRGKDTSPELKVRKHLHALGFRFRIHVRSLPGIPDIVLPKYRLIIFVHGCFWHRHGNCRFASTPDDPTGKWSTKFQNTLKRDDEVVATLVAQGWRVFILWECGITKGGQAENLNWLEGAIKDASVEFRTWPEMKSQFSQ